eukprot:CAMPEP_0170527570 /NCGR_PEP_ID=MMETSP0209-20121228/13040_1 /TAXON_ID=665100 ORGANISM="Litonotus pictus, Strain P1" /NCGR_SAMPLE_ID=MMETSP0209 /ASSEMBLY_ACC=CAM_ASM_000301 /LENGTH=170 /DNA_ID=CAMNT_0010818193 /DNA_START=9 /DNA_END=521 /DNA_ORIENTATION=-
MKYTLALFLGMLLTMTTPILSSSCYTNSLNMVNDVQVQNENLKQRVAVLEKIINQANHRSANELGRWDSNGSSIEGRMVWGTENQGDQNSAMTMSEDGTTITFNKEGYYKIQTVVLDDAARKKMSLTSVQKNGEIVSWTHQSPPIENYDSNFMDLTGNFEVGDKVVIKCS